MLDVSTPDINTIKNNLKTLLNIVIKIFINNLTELQKIATWIWEEIIMIINDIFTIDLNFIESILKKCPSFNSKQLILLFQNDESVWNTLLNVVINLISTLLWTLNQTIDILIAFVSVIIHEIHCLYNFIISHVVIKKLDNNNNNPWITLLKNFEILLTKITNLVIYVFYELSPIVYNIILYCLKQIETVIKNIFGNKINLHTNDILSSNINIEQLKQWGISTIRFLFDGIVILTNIFITLSESILKWLLQDIICLIAKPLINNVIYDQETQNIILCICNYHNNIKSNQLFDLSHLPSLDEIKNLLATWINYLVWFFIEIMNFLDIIGRIAIDLIVDIISKIENLIPHNKYKHTTTSIHLNNNIDLQQLKYAALRFVNFFFFLLRRTFCVILDIGYAIVDLIQIIVDNVFYSVNNIGCIIINNQSISKNLQSLEYQKNKNHDILQQSSSCNDIFVFIFTIIWF